MQRRLRKAALVGQGIAGDAVGEGEQPPLTQLGGQRARFVQHQQLLRHAVHEAQRQRQAGQAAGDAGARAMLAPQREHLLVVLHIGLQVAVAPQQQHRARAQRPSQGRHLLQAACQRDGLVDQRQHLHRVVAQAHLDAGHAAQHLGAVARLVGREQGHGGVAGRGIALAGFEAVHGQQRLDQGLPVAGRRRRHAAQLLQCVRRQQQVFEHRAHRQQGVDGLLWTGARHIRVGATRQRTQQVAPLGLHGAHLGLGAEATGPGRHRLRLRSAQQRQAQRPGLQKDELAHRLEDLEAAAAVGVGARVGH